MTVQLTQQFKWQGALFPAGSAIVLPDYLAQNLIRYGLAREIVGEIPRAAVANERSIPRTEKPKRARKQEK